MPAVEFGPKIEGEVGRIKTSDDLTDKDIKVFLEYKRDLEVEGLSDSRIYKVLYQTKKLAEQLGGRSLADAMEEDVKSLPLGWRGATTPSGLSLTTGK